MSTNEVKEPASEFESEAAKRRRGFVEELWAFLKHNKKWWLIPIIVMIVVLGVLVVLSATGLAPFIYTMF